MYISTFQLMIILVVVSVTYQVMLTQIIWHSTLRKIAFNVFGGFLAWLGVFFPAMYFFFGLKIVLN